MSKTCDRRSMLRMTGAAALGLAFLPALRRAIAAVGPSARARRILILNLAGGVRSSAAFHASSQVPYNPWLMMASSTGTGLRLGRLLDDNGLPDSAYQLGPAWNNVRVPRLREMASQFGVLGTWLEERGDHARARIEEATGSRSGTAPGLLTRIARGFAVESATVGVPPFHISPTAQFGFASGDMISYAPIAISGASSMPRPRTPDAIHLRETGNDWAADDAMRNTFDQHKLARRHSVPAVVTSTMHLQRRAARNVGERVTRPDIFLEDPAGTAGGVTNAMLLELMTRAASANPAFTGQAVNAALAVRLLQADCPAVCVELGNFDLHSGEEQAAPPLYTFLGRLWASLHFLLSRVPDPIDTNRTLLDRTLVVTMSDFGRDRAGERGFNGGGGSDHGADPGCYYLAHAVMGAGTRTNTVVGAADTNTYDGRSVAPSPDRLLATLLHAVGLDARNEIYGLPTSAPITELWP